MRNLTEYAAELRRRGEMLIAAAAAVESVIESETVPPTTATGAVETIRRAAWAEKTTPRRRATKTKPTGTTGRGAPTSCEGYEGHTCQNKIAYKGKGVRSRRCPDCTKQHVRLKAIARRSETKSPDGESVWDGREGLTSVGETRRP